MEQSRDEQGALPSAEDLLLDDMDEVAIARAHDRPELIGRAQCVPIKRRVTKEHPYPSLRRERLIGCTDRIEKPLVDRCYAAPRAGPSFIPPNRAQICGRNGIACDKPIHHLLVQRIAKFHHDGLHTLWEGRMLHEVGNEGGFLFQAVRLTESHDREPVEESQDPYDRVRWLRFL
jgi:hypothetical protein